MGAYRTEQERTRKAWKGGFMFKRFGEPVRIDDELMATISSYMDDEIREELHYKLAPCTPEEFLSAYTERDDEFPEILKNEFGIEEEEDIEKGSYEHNIRVLIADGCTHSEAVRYLERKGGAGVIIFDAEDFEKNFETYMKEWGGDDEESYRKMISEKEPVTDWSVVECDGSVYYIQYFN